MTKWTLGIVIATAFVVGTISMATMAIADDDDNNEFSAKLKGSNEVPPVVTDTTGNAEFKVNKAETKLKYSLTIKKGDEIKVAHIHCAPAGMNGPVILWLLDTGMVGALDGKVKIAATLTDDKIVDDTCGDTISKIVDSMKMGKTYVNVHSTDVPSGEVRGQIASNNDDDDDD